VNLDHLTSLTDGWLDGDGKAPSPVAIAVTRAICLFSEAHGLRCYSYPTPDGGVQTEWDDGPVAEARVSENGSVELDMAGVRTVKRYFLDEDNSGHWCIVEADHRAEWEAWISLDASDERAWTTPDFARGIDGPSRVTFAVPEGC